MIQVVDQTSQTVPLHVANEIMGNGAKEIDNVISKKSRRSTNRLGFVIYAAVLFGKFEEPSVTELVEALRALH